jgi:hypothetical protein
VVSRNHHGPGNTRDRVFRPPLNPVTISSAPGVTVNNPMFPGPHSIRRGKAVPKTMPVIVFHRVSMMRGLYRTCLWKQELKEECDDWKIEME